MATGDVFASVEWHGRVVFREGREEERTTYRARVDRTRRHINGVRPAERTRVPEEIRTRARPRGTVGTGTRRALEAALLIVRFHCHSLIGRCPKHAVHGQARGCLFVLSLRAFTNNVYEFKFVEITHSHLNTAGSRRPFRIDVCLRYAEIFSFFLLHTIYVYGRLRSSPWRARRDVSVKRKRTVCLAFPSSDARTL